MPIIDKIFLLGAMGAGKSSLAKSLAVKLSWSFVDLDERIEQQCSQSIQQIFANLGEDRFRALERECLLQLRKERQVVVATGGGVVLSSENRQFLRENSGNYCIFLSADLDTLIARLDAQQRQQRPLLQGADWQNNLAALLQKRQSLWRECADLSVATDHKELELVCSELLAELRPLLDRK